MQTLPTPSPNNTSDLTSPDSTVAAFETTIRRRKTRPVPVGNITIGGGHPVVGSIHDQRRHHGCRGISGRDSAAS